MLVTQTSPRSKSFFYTTQILSVLLVSGMVSGGGMSNTIPKLLDAQAINKIISVLIVAELTDRQVVPMFGEITNRWESPSLNIRPQFSNVNNIVAFFQRHEITLNLNGIEKLPLAELIKFYGQPLQPPLGTDGHRAVVFSREEKGNLCRLIVRIPLNVALADAPVQTLGIQCTYNR